MTPRARIARIVSVAALACLGAGGLPVAFARGAARHRATHPRSRIVAWPGRPFAPNSVWNRPLRRRARLSRHSHADVAEVVRQVDDYGPWLNTYAYSVPVYLVPADQRRTRVTLDT